MLLRGCERCRRHVDEREITCPFCRAPLAPTTTRPTLVASRLGRAAVFAGATLVGPVAGCWTDAKTPPTTPIDHERVDTTPAAIPAGTIRGRVVNTATGEPLRGVSVEIRLPSGDIAYATSNQQGEFEFKNLAPGKYTVEYLSGDPREPPQGQSVTLAEGTGSYVDVPISFPEPDRGPCCKPYGAPPARRRIV